MTVAALAAESPDNETNAAAPNATAEMRRAPWVMATSFSLGGAARRRNAPLPLQIRRSALPIRKLRPGHEYVRPNILIAIFILRLIYRSRETGCGPQTQRRLQETLKSGEGSRLADDVLRKGPVEFEVGGWDVARIQRVDRAGG